MAKGVRFLPVFIILAMLACIVNVSAVALYDEAAGTVVPHNLSGVYWYPDVDGVPTYDLIVTLTRDANSPYTSFGYYIIANAQQSGLRNVELFPLQEGKNPLKSNQYLGFWAKDADDGYYFSTSSRSNPFSLVDEMTAAVSGRYYSGWWDWRGTPTKDTIVFSLPPAPDDDTPAGGEGGNTTTGAPLPEALASLFLMGGLGGSLSLRKRRKK